MEDVYNLMQIERYDVYECKYHLIVLMKDMDVYECNYHLIVLMSSSTMADNFENCWQIFSAASFFQ